MPIKDREKSKKYFKNYMATKRAKEKGLTEPHFEGLTTLRVKPKKQEVGLTNEKENVKPVKPIGDNSVKPDSEMLNPELVKPLEDVKPIIESVQGLTSSKTESNQNNNQKENKCPNCLILENHLQNIKQTNYKRVGELFKEISANKQTIRDLLSKNQILEKKCKELEIKPTNYLTISKEAEIIPLFYDRGNKKLITHSCRDTCYTGKSCNNCWTFSVSVND